MIEGEMNPTLANVEPIDLDDDITKQEEKSRSIRFKPSTFSAIRKKWYEWRRTKAIKKEIKESVKIATKTNDIEYQESIMKHVSKLMSEYIFLKTETEDTWQLIGDRAIKLNANMTESVRKNQKMILKKLKEEVKDAEFEEAKSMPFDEKESFISEVNEAESGVPEAEENKTEINLEDYESVQPINETAEQQSTEQPTMNTDEKGLYGMTREEIVQDVNPYDVEAEQTFATAGMSDEEIAERRRNLGFEDSQSDESVKMEDINEDVFTVQEEPEVEETQAEPTPEEDEIKNKEISREDLQAILEKATIRAQEAKGKEKKTEATKEVVNMDPEEVEEKYGRLEELQKRRMEAIERKKAAEAKKLAAKEDAEENERRNAEKWEAFNSALEELNKQTEEVEKEAMSEEEEYEELMAKNKQIDEENEKLDSGINSILEMLKASENTGSKKRK